MNARVTFLAVVGLGALWGALASGQSGKLGYDDTPLQPGGKWRVHDGQRPQPRVVTPPATLGSTGAPSDAQVLIGAGNDLGAWQGEKGGPIAWTMADGVLQVGKGNIRTKAEFTDFQLHVEFATPAQVVGEGQGRGNSGIFLLGAFEIQVLDSYRNPTYPDGQAGAMYGQYPPLVNVARPPGEWQTYDVVFTAARFSAQGVLDRPARVTVLHNGVVVHNGTAFTGPTSHKKVELYAPTMGKGPIGLQDHGNPNRFRNMWIRPLGDYDQS